MLTDRVKQMGYCVTSRPCSFHFHPLEALGNDVEESLHYSWRDHVDRGPELSLSLRRSTIWLRPSWIILSPPQLNLQRMSTARVTTGKTRRRTTNAHCRIRKNKWFLCSRHNGCGSFYVFGLYECNGKYLCHVKALRRWWIEWLFDVCFTLCYYTNLNKHQKFALDVEPVLLGWVAFPFSRGSSQVSHIAGGFFTSWATREVQE